MGGLLHDLRYGLRRLLGNPLFTLAAVSSLAIGIGANTAIFSLIDSLMLRWLPVAHPEQLYSLNTVTPDEEYSRFSWPRFQRAQALLAPVPLCAFTPYTVFYSPRAGEPPESVRADLVSGNYFSVIGVHASLGRVLSPDDNRPGAPPVAVISYAYWQRRYGRDPSIIGRSLALNGVPVTIVGVAPAGFFGTEPGDSLGVWVPLMLQPALHYADNAASHNSDTDKPWPPQNGIEWLTVVGRFTSDSQRQATSSALAAFAKREFAETYGSSRPGVVERLRSYHLVMRRAGRGLGHEAGAPEFQRAYAAALRVLMFMVAVVLLVACANVANLLLARGVARAREFSVKAAIGARRARLLRELLIESATLALLGGLAGLLMGVWGSRALLYLADRSAPAAVRPSLNWLVLGFTVLLAAATTLIFGLLPALRSTRFDLVHALKSGQPQAAGVASRFSAGKALVVIQVGFTLVLLAAAGLFVRSMRKLLDVDPGFDARHVLTVPVDLRAAGYTPAQLAVLYQRVVEKLRALPGAVSVSPDAYAPVSGGTRSSGIFVPGYDSPNAWHEGIDEDLVGPDYFATLGIQLIAGRDFDGRDRAGAQQVAIINQTMAAHYFGRGNPLGRHYGNEADPNQFEIIGVVRDIKVTGVREPVPRMAYMPIAQSDVYASYFDVRFLGDNASSFIAEIRRGIAAVNPNIPVRGVSTLAEHIDDSLSDEALAMRVSALFSLLALVLAALGLYGVMAFTVARRTGEIGIRMALGAERARLLGMVLRESIVLVLAGIVFGLPLAIAGAHALQSSLFGVTPSDPLTFSVAALVVLLTGTVAGFLPAHRAAKVDPMVALRYE